MTGNSKTMRKLRVREENRKEHTKNTVTIKTQTIEANYGSVTSYNSQPGIKMGGFYSSRAHI